MTSYVVKILPALICLAAVLNAQAFDVTEKRVEHIDLTEKDIVKKDEMLLITKKFFKDFKLRDNKRESRFIGDLVIGERLADETIFRRSVEISNPTDQVYNSAIMLSVERGTIHYVSVNNEKNSYAVACDEPYSLGTSRTSFNVRVPPNTKSQLWLLVAAH
ncbi:hypothetical protein TSAR_000113 [Trichomalopsis sarcophagae]|uniref:Uncharacterized protein n=1 Tax=Trichomalopsis sarcophagae TaxID=543379 RepID=A0A232EX04_9HYME|nr:hypothetical protein TSAR_000113 [Trichomalopsis sarcophagae]